METPEGDRVIWVAPTPSLTSSDIESALPGTDQAGRRSVAIRFTDAGSEKMRKLSAAQINKPIAMVLDGKLIWAPVVRSEIARDASITGGANGLTQEDVQRILASVNQK
jgi:preprotein translocase subunit SecD